MYCNYLYWTSHILYKQGLTQIADKVYYLNKMLNGVDLFYAIDLPEHWNCEHPLGSVMGRAKYGDNFFFYQGCTIGGSSGNYPELGHDVVMFSNSKILGKSRIGNDVILSANTYVIDSDIPDNCLVFPAPDGDGRHPKILQKSEAEMIERISHFFYKA